jgi:hypothetical protein
MLKNFLWMLLEANIFRTNIFLTGLSKAKTLYLNPFISFEVPDANADELIPTTR